MKKKNVVLVSILCMILCTGLAFAAPPAQGGNMKAPAHNVSGKLHPNLSAAQRLVEQAFNKINAAQEANEFDMGGHAAKAKTLIDQANSELKQAAEAANKNDK
jgi:hypothetical protein